MVPVDWTLVTPGSRAIIAGAGVGSSAVPPVRLCPFWTVSRLVPSWLISASSPAEDDADRPSTATIAATPIAIPSPDKLARSFLVRSPTAARRARSARRSRAGDGGRAAAAVAVVMAGAPAGWRGEPACWDTSIPIRAETEAWRGGR